MSKYSNVNCDGISIAINKARNDIKTQNFDSINNDIRNKNTFDSETVQNKILNIIDRITTSKTLNGSLVNLSDKINVLSKSIGSIKKIQSNEKEIENLKPRLYYNRKIQRYTYDNEGNITGTMYDYVRTLDQSVQNQIKTLEKDIKSLEYEVDNLLS